MYKGSMKKVIYINIEPLTKQIFRNFFIKELLQNGIEVEYWDMSGLYSHDFAITDSISSDIIVKIHHKNEVTKKINCEDVEDTIFIPSSPYEWDSLWLYRLFLNNRCYIAFFGRGALPFPKRKNGISRIVQRVREKEIVHLWKGFLNKCAVYLRGKGMAKKYDVVFAAGRKEIEQNKNESQIIEVNHLDYDHFLSLKGDATKLVKGRYAVFLDNNMPYHPDWNILKMRTINADDYFRGVNRFFEMVEKKWGVRVVIAAHPTSDYKQSIYHGREMFKYKTNELVKDCDFVLSHITTSVSFSVLYEKPVLFLCSNEMKTDGPGWVFPFIENLAKVVGGEVYNVDDIYSEDHIMLPTVDPGKYKKYKYDYLTSPKSENCFTKDVFLDFLRTD